MDLAHPELSKNFYFLEVFVAFLHMEKVENITEYIDNGIEYHVLESWNLD